MNKRKIRKEVFVISKRFDITDRKIVKVLVCGDSGVGKTELVKALSDDILDYGGSTIGANFGIKRLHDEDNSKNIVFQFWDLSGDARFWHIFPLLAYGADLILYVFDLTSQKTLDHVKDWYQFFVRFVGQVPNILVGNKLDLRESNPNLDKVKEIIKPMSVVFTSAVKNINIEQLYKSIISVMQTSKKNIGLSRVIKRVVSVKIVRF
ncbi:MAG: Rab family GTPase [Candidatus Asgardarchaeia archaeon]